MILCTSTRESVISAPDFKQSTRQMINTNSDKNADETDREYVF